jgi:hypothetical protein
VVALVFMEKVILGLETLSVLDAEALAVVMGDFPRLLLTLLQREHKAVFMEAAVEVPPQFIGLSVVMEQMEQ